MDWYDGNVDVWDLKTCRDASFKRFQASHQLTFNVIICKQLYMLMPVGALGMPAGKV
jgi:hypothetical protein